MGEVGLLVGRFVGATLSDGSKRGFLLHKDCKSASLLQTIDLESENREFTNRYVFLILYVRNVGL